MAVLVADGSEYSLRSFNRRRLKSLASSLFSGYSFTSVAHSFIPVGLYVVRFGTTVSFSRLRSEKALFQEIPKLTLFCWCSIERVSHVRTHIRIYTYTLIEHKKNECLFREGIREIHRNFYTPIRLSFEIPSRVFISLHFGRYFGKKKFLKIHRFEVAMWYTACLLKIFFCKVNQLKTTMHDATLFWGNYIRGYVSCVGVYLTSSINSHKTKYHLATAPSKNPDSSGNCRNTWRNHHRSWQTRSFRNVIFLYLTAAVQIKRHYFLTEYKYTGFRLKFQIQRLL